ncbi:MAG: hypothetical protein WA326_06170, partial [Nitrososphaeraceae archaeon]
MKIFEIRVGLSYQTSGIATTPIEQVPTFVVTGWLQIYLFFKTFTKKDFDLLKNAQIVPGSGNIRPDLTRYVIRLKP